MTNPTDKDLPSMWADAFERGPLAQFKEIRKRFGFDSRRNLTNMEIIGLLAVWSLQIIADEASQSGGAQRELRAMFSGERRSFAEYFGIPESKGKPD